MVAFWYCQTLLFPVVELFNKQKISYGEMASEGFRMNQVGEEEHGWLSKKQLYELLPSVYVQTPAAKSQPPAPKSQPEASAEEPVENNEKADDDDEKEDEPPQWKINFPQQIRPAYETQAEIKQLLEKILKVEEKVEQQMKMNTTAVKSTEMRLCTGPVKPQQGHECIRLQGMQLEQFKPSVDPEFYPRQLKHGMHQFLMSHRSLRRLS